MALQLRHRIHGDTHDDQQRGAAEIEGNPGIADQEFRQQTHQREIEGADNRDAGQHIVDVFRGALTRTDARNEAAILLQVLRRLLRIEHDGGVEEGKENNQHHIKRKKQRLGRGQAAQ